MDDDELVDAWLDENKIRSFEGDPGLAKLEKLVAVLGYEGHGFRYGSPIEQFLSDNPGACDAIVEFIREWTERIPEWAENFRDELPEEDEDDDVCRCETDDGLHLPKCGSYVPDEEGV